MLTTELRTLLLVAAIDTEAMLQFVLQVCSRPPRNLAFLAFDLFQDLQELYSNSCSCGVEHYDSSFFHSL